MSDASTSSFSPTPLVERQLRVARRIAVVATVAAGVALAIAVVALLRAPAPALPGKLDELTVGRLNVVEPDGTPRMIVSSRARFPGSFLRGKEIPRPDRRDEAGILFVDDEGTENGGLVQSGKLGSDGKVQAGASLTFDRFRQDQMVQVLLDETDDNATAGVIIHDRPSHKVFSLDDIVRLMGTLSPADRDAQVQRHVEQGHFGHRRGYFGLDRDSSTLVLSDPQGRPRLRLRVSDRGEPSIELLDESGHAVQTVTPPGH